LSPPPYPFDTQLLYTSDVIVGSGDNVTEEYTSKPELLEVRKVSRKKVKRERLFSWKFRIDSSNKPYYSTFEIFVPAPVADELQRKEPVVMVKLQNSSRHAYECISVTDFLSSPFSLMLNKPAKDRLVESVANYQDEWKVLAEDFVSGMGAV
jgi:hypothetical protein